MRGLMRLGEWERPWPRIALPLTRIASQSDLSPQKGGERLRTHPTNPCIGFTALLSGNTLSASTFSANPN